ncbi:MAG: hypothetical protein SVK08_04660 [Halobacteriota archaeon]|nr:hypothetical protein [Halobacteriota archaeon]
MGDKMSDSVISKLIERDVFVETASGSVYEGKIASYDDFGVLFYPKDTNKFSTALISWNDLKKVILTEKGVVKI